jgi:hypothetical protein
MNLSQSFQRFLSGNQRSQNSSSSDLIFIPIPLDLFSSPVLGRIEVEEGREPRVRFAGTSWPIKLLNSDSESLFIDGQEVLIMGRQGISLLISGASQQSPPN